MSKPLRNGEEILINFVFPDGNSLINRRLIYMVEKENGAIHYNLQKIWFTSDHHFGHKNIIKFQKRPWDTVEEMNEGLIKNWNDTVGEKDVVFVLGDMFLTKTVEEARDIRAKLKGSIRFIFGNHDDIAFQMRDVFEWSKDYYYGNLPFQGRKQSIVLMHYPIFRWRGRKHSQTGSWHLFGHEHGTINRVENGPWLDVGVDSHNYRPVSWEDVCDKMLPKILIPPDPSYVKE